MKEYTAKLFEYKGYVSGPEDRFLLGESPFYNKKLDRFSWVDIIAGKLYILENGTRKEIDFGEPIGAAIPLDDGTFIIAGRKALWKYNVRDNEKELICDMSEHYANYQRSNDAKLDPVGRILVGSSVEDGDSHAPSGNLFQYSDSSLRILEENTRISNGMAWSADSSRFFFSDSLKFSIFAYDYDIETGNAANKQVLFSVPEDESEGITDGMTIDKDDRLWVAFWGGSRIECRNSLTGELEAVIRVPAENVTSCYFYDDDKLFITTAGNNMTGEYDGRLFMCQI